MGHDRIYNRIKDFRLKVGIRQEDVAEGIGVSRQTIIAIERGNYVPSVMLALRLSAFFHVPVENLFSLEKDGKSK